MFLFHLALRVAECANLQWKDLELSSQKASINQKCGIIKTLPIPHGLCLLLQEFSTLYGNTCPFIFQPLKNNRTNVLEKPISTRGIYNIIKSDNYSFIWYENPKMTIEDIYHVQVFWIKNN